MRNCDRSGKKMRRRSRHRQPGMPGSCQFRMMVRGGAGSGGPVWPTISCSGEAVISAAAKRSLTPAAAGIAAKGARQNWLQNSTLPSSPGGHLSQSPMPPPAIAAGDMASAMLVALAPCATVPAANTASRTIASMRARLSMTFHASPFLRHVQIQAVAASTSRIARNPAVGSQSLNGSSWRYLLVQAAGLKRQNFHPSTTFARSPNGDREQVVD
jgi:hypothetical protein